MMSIYILCFILIYTNKPYPSSRRSHRRCCSWNWIQCSSQVLRNAYMYAVIPENEGMRKWRNNFDMCWVTL